MGAETSEYPATLLLLMLLLLLLLLLMLLLLFPLLSQCQENVSSSSSGKNKINLRSSEEETNEPTNPLLGSASVSGEIVSEEEGGGCRNLFPCEEAVFFLLLNWRYYCDEIDSFTWDLLPGS